MNEQEIEDNYIDIMSDWHIVHKLRRRSKERMHGRLQKRNVIQRGH